MNQVGAALVVGCLVGLALGLTLAPSGGLSMAAKDGEDLLCLAERTQLMDEVRVALKKMETAGCVNPVDSVVPEPVKVMDRVVEAVVDAGSPDRVAPAAVLEKPVDSSGLDAGAPAVRSAPVAVVAVKAEPKVPLKPAKKVVRQLSASSAWFVQLIATADPAEAGKVERRARDLGLQTRIVLEEVADQSRSLYKVRVGPFPDKVGGVEALRRVKRALKITGWLHRAD